MSAIDSTCFAVTSERGSRTDKMNCFIPPPYDGSTIANEIASEVVNEILENAMDIVTQKEKQPSEQGKISTVVVGDILENILSKAINNNDTAKTIYVKDETNLLDDEIKRIINEMKYPPEKNIICTKGVGDQLANRSGVVLSDVVLEQPSKRNTLERKNRLTNLVKNSKHILSKFLTNDTEKPEVEYAAEEENETVLKVTDFEETPVVEETKEPIQGGDSTNDSTMQVVDLKTSEQVCEKSEEKSRGEVEEAETETKSKEAGTSKKKIGLGAKFMKYLRKNSKKEKKDETVQ